MTTQLSRHFALEEFMAPKVPEDYPAQWIDSKLLPLVDRLEWLRNTAGAPVIITSAYRSPDHNAAVGGVNDSQHIDGDAADTYTPLIPLGVLASRAQASILEGSAPAFGQLIFYADKGHAHISNPAARLGDRNGQALFSPGLEVDDATGRVTRIYRPLADAIANGEIPFLSERQTREGLLSQSSWLSSWSSSSPSSHVHPAGSDHA